MIFFPEIMAWDHPEDALLPGTILGRYEILRVLGRGGFGVTYAARNLGQSGEMVAIKEFFPLEMCVRDRGRKTILPAPGADGQAIRDSIAMFRRESEVICCINHPNLVRGIEWLQDNNTGYLVMAYVSGKTLREHLRSPGGDFRVGPAVIAQLCRGIISALGCLHENRVFHCDIKPDNIFLGIGFEPILIDLGSASLQLHAGTALPGTYSRHYSAIEQMDPRFGAIGPWTDIYQFSAVLYRCLTGGKLPDSADRVAGSEDPFMPLKEIGPILEVYPRAFLEGVDSGLSRFPKDRPQSIKQWSDLIDPALESMASARRPAKDKPRGIRSQSPGPDSSEPRRPPALPRKATPAPTPKTSDPLVTTGFILIAVVVVVILMLLLKGCGN